MNLTTSATLELCFWPSKVNFLSHVNEFEMSLSFPNLHFVVVSATKKRLHNKTLFWADVL